MKPSEGMIVWISGPPAAGKSTLAESLVQSFERALIIPVDEIRGWVKSGAAGPVPWTEETERQYRLGEEAACDVAVRYVKAGFVAIIDACRSPGRVDELLQKCASGIQCLKILLHPDLEVNLKRAHSRTGKNFDPYFLDEIISVTHRNYPQNISDDWLLLDNSELSVEQEIEAIFHLQGKRE